MTETKNKKTVTISEEDIALLLERYSARKIIALLQEVAQFADAKIDWNELVKKTSTGITNAREYQMVWRHLAYRDPLLENVDGSEPLDDDSDLEIDLEAVPAVSEEESAEAAACASVLLASGFPSDSSSLNCSTMEGPLFINIPAGPAYPQGKNIVVPVVVPKHKEKKSVPTMPSTEGLEGSGSAAGGSTLKRKRMPWTEEEDMELIAAVQKCGERNWANILKGDFTGKRTASQLSQRWAIIRKRQTNLNPSGSCNPASSQLTEAQLATRRAVSHALNMPMVDNLLAACSVGAPQSGIPSGSAAVPSGPEDASLGAQTQQVPQSKGTSNMPSKSRVTTVPVKKGAPVPMKSFPTPNPMIQAAAVAAGARIATPSTAASLLKAAQSKNVVHIRPGGGSVIKPQIPSVAKSSAATSHLGAHPNVHYIRTGLTPASAPPTYSGTSPSIPPQPGSNQQEHGKMATGSNPFPPSTALCTLPSNQMTSTSSCAALSGTDEGKLTDAIATAPLSKADAISEEAGSQKELNWDIPKVETLTENQTSAAENLKQPQNVGGGEIEYQLNVSKQNESSDVINPEQ